MRGRGDLYFTVNIIVPKKVTGEQKELLEQLREKSKDTVQENKSLFDKLKEFLNRQDLRFCLFFYRR